MTQNDAPQMQDLDALLKQASDAPVELPAGLAARVLADAQMVQLHPRVSPLSRPSIWAQAMDMLGGWPAVSGLAAATCAGFWIGVSPPQSVPDAGALLLGVQAIEFEDETAELSGFGWDLDEG